MTLESYQLEKYKAVMGKKLIKASKQDHIIHGYMVYQCDHCNNIYVMWLEKGLEDPTDDEKTGMHKPVPFGFICPACGAMATHTLWFLGKSGLGKNYKSYQKYVEKPNRLIYRNFFWNDPTVDCGVPIIFEPDYWEEKGKTIDYITTEIDIHTLPDKEYEELIDAVNTIPESFSLEDEEPIALLNLECNREQRRCGSYGKDGYERPRSNKKLYEY